jgi:hypothetical protein
MSQNFTSIDDLVQEYRAMKHGSSASTKESLPTFTPEVTKKSELNENEKNEVEANNVDAFITSKRDDSISLPPDLKKAGVKTSTDADDQFKTALYKIRFPISDEKIMDDLKAPPSESKRWFATILLYILERAHLTLKRVGSKVVRILKTN